MKKAGSDPALVRARSGYFFSIDDFFSVDAFLSDDFLVDAFFSVDLAGAAFFSVDFAGAAFFSIDFSAFLSCAIAETLTAANAAASNTVTSCFIVKSPSLQRV